MKDDKKKTVLCCNLWTRIWKGRSCKGGSGVSGSSGGEERLESGSSPGGREDDGG